jgi:hypothetical protein
LIHWTQILYVNTSNGAGTARATARDCAIRDGGFELEERSGFPGNGEAGRKTKTLQTPGPSLPQKWAKVNNADSMCGK